jgi:hypothetical protein
MSAVAPMPIPEVCPEPVGGCFACRSSGSTRVEKSARIDRGRALHLIRVYAPGPPQASLSYAEWITRHRYPSAVILRRAGVCIDHEARGVVEFEVPS